MDRREELAIAVAHVARGEQLIEQQRQVVARLAGCGGDVEFARELLGRFELTLASLRDHRDLVSREVEEEALRPDRWR